MIEHRHIWSPFLTEALRLCCLLSDERSACCCWLMPSFQPQLTLDCGSHSQCSLPRSHESPLLGKTDHMIRIGPFVCILCPLGMRRGTWELIILSQWFNQSCLLQWNYINKKITLQLEGLESCGVGCIHGKAGGIYTISPEEWSFLCSDLPGPHPCTFPSGVHLYLT